MIISHNESNNRLEETSVFITLKTQITAMSPAIGEAFGDVLVLKDKTNKTFNFSWFDLPQYSAEKRYIVTIDDQQFSIKTSTLAWIIWGDLANNIKSQNVKKIVFENLLFLFAYLTLEQVKTLTVKLLSTFLETMLTYSVNENGLNKKLGISGVARFMAFDPQMIAVSCNKLAMQDSLIESTSNKRLIRTLNDVLLRVGDISYADYVEGGSFNYLTLDIGQHYINHLNEQFNKYYYSAYAVAKVVNQRTEILKEYEDNALNLQLLRLTMLEVHSDEQKKLINKHRNFFDIIKKRAAISFERHYKQALWKFALFSEKALENLIERLGLANTDDNKFFTKSLLSISLSKEDISEQEIIEDFSHTLEYLADSSKVTLTKFKSEKKKVIDELIMQAEIVKPDTKISSIANFDTTVGRFGFTNIMALLGWRESEYTFPETAINLSRNHDVVDQMRYPISFKVKWKVPKTAGETKINREITLNSYILLKQLQALHCSDETQPMLFKNELDSQSIDIGRRANTACVAGWKHFTINYIPFVELDRLDELQEKRVKGVLTIQRKILC